VSEAPPFRPRRLHPVNREHLDALAGDLGILQHALGSRPDPTHGYCVDDVARALEVDLLHARVLPWTAVRDSAWRSLLFLEAAFAGPRGRLRNFRTIDGTWDSEPASGDSQGRAMLALAEAAASAPDPELAARATALFDRALPGATRLTSPRAQASLILACAAAPNAARNAVMNRMATELHVRFRTFARPGWPWPESTLTYENAVIPRAMIVAGQTLGATTMVAIGLQVLDWLLEVQTGARGRLSPIGNSWWAYRGVRPRFDQQPIEATALLLAAEAALSATGKAEYRDAMERAYGWFLGANDSSVPVADPARGACRDGLTPDGVNVNEGAESTLMWLIAVEHIRAARSAAAGAAPERAARQPSIRRDRESRSASAAGLSSGAPS